MSARTRRSVVFVWSALFVFSLGLQYLNLASPASALALTGAIYTSNFDGSIINENVGYPSKSDVYLTGGPCNGGSHLAAGDYYFEVKSPSGVLLSSDAIGNRKFTVGANGFISSTSGTHLTHPVNCDPPQTGVTVQLIPFDDTPNPGGEYKLTVATADTVEACADFNADSTSFEICNRADQKTDNFKVAEAFGSLTLVKSLTGGPDGYTGPFTIKYDCGVAASGDVAVSVGAPETISGIPAGESCTVSEPNLPSVPGYSFGTPTFSPSATVTIVKDATVTVTTNNSLTRDLGSFKITKSVSNPDGATLPASFTGTYDCGTGYTGTWSVAAGGSQTISGIPTGNTCSVTEDALTPIPGYTWGTPSFTPTSVVIDTKGGTFEIVVGNSITRDLGGFKVFKVLSNPDGANVPASFTVDYDCGTGYTGQVSVAPGSPATVSGIPTGNTCSVTEVAPAAIPGFTWGAVTYTPTSVVIDEEATVSITVGNSITRDRGSLQILKTLSNPDGANVPASFTVDYDCGTGYTGQVSVAPGSPATVSGIPTGNTCSVTEVAPAAIPGFTWGAVTYTPTSVVIDEEATVSITVGNSITRDLNPVLTLDKSNDAPIETIDLGDGNVIELPTVGEGDTVTYTLDYTLVDGPVTDGVLTDVLPVGVEYVAGSAQGNDEFSFVSYDAATRTLLWTAATVTKNGTVSYDVVVQGGAAELAQPLVNVAEISSKQTPPDGAESNIYVNPPPQVLTPPPTDTFEQAPQGGSNIGFVLMLILLMLAGTAVLTGFLTPVPARARKSREDGR